MLRFWRLGDYSRRGLRVAGLGLAFGFGWRAEDFEGEDKGEQAE